MQARGIRPRSPDRMIPLLVHVLAPRGSLALCGTREEFASLSAALDSCLALIERLARNHRAGRGQGGASQG